MQLTAQNIIGYLTDQALVPHEKVLNGQFCWYAIRSRNQVFIIRDQQGGGLFLKQANSDKALIMKEANALHILHHFSDFESVKPFIPQFYSYHPELHVLVTEYLQGARSVLELTELRGQLSLSQAKAMSEVMARFHADLRNDLDRDPSLQFFDPELPWILKLPNVTNYAKEVVLEQIRQDEFLLHKLDEVARGWSNTSLIHGDIHLANFMIKESENGDQLKLTDWEMANIGDPLWDLAGLMQAYLAHGLRFSSASSDHYQLPESKAYWSREHVHKVWAVIWESYGHLMNWSVTETGLAAEKVVGFIAARLLQSAAELNRVSPEFLAPGAWAMIAEARTYLRQPQQVIRALDTSTHLSHEF